MRYYPILLLTFLCLGRSNIYSQNQNINSTESLKKRHTEIKELYYAYKYPEAIRNCFELIEESQRSNNDDYEFLGLIGLGHVHYLMKDTSKARAYNLKALEKAIETKSDSLIAWAYNDLANVQVVTKHNYEKMIDYYKKAIDIYNKNPTFSLPIAENMNIADAYLTVEQPEKAHPHLTAAQKLAKTKRQHELLLLNLNILLGRYYCDTGDYDNALKVLEEYISLAEDKYFIQASKSYLCLSIAYEKKQDWAKANYFLKKKNEIDSKLHDIKQKAILAGTNAKFELEMYQNELKTTKNQRDDSEKFAKKSKYLNIISAILSVILLIGLIAIFVLAKNRKKYIKQLSIKNSELIEAKNKAEHLSKLKTQFFSTISHEIRTPLYGVIGLSSILLDDKELSDSHKTDLTSLKFSADYLLALINDVLMLSKMENNGIKLEKTTYNFKILINNIIQSFCFSLEQNNNKIITNIDSKIPNLLIGDSIRLSQILMNLIGNAVKFNENGSIWVTVELIKITEQGKYLSQFTIKDDGIGIPLEKQQSIFDEFSQLQNRHYNYQGTGLGLPIVVKLLALHNSKINLKSTPNEGATFSFTLELEANSAIKNNTKESIESVSTESKEILFENCHILIIDDNKINQKITKKILEGKHFKCSIASNGEEAIALAKENKYQLILMDINMPKLDGYEATKAIRLFDKKTPIIALTAIEASEVREKIITVGMNDLILKPYDNSLFFTTILKNLNNNY